MSSKEAINGIQPPAEALPYFSFVTSAQSFIRTSRASTRMVRRELTSNKITKKHLLDKIYESLEMPQYADADNFEDDRKLIESKFLRFRPRLVGAVAAYSLIAGISHDEMLQQGGMDAFYLFWALGSIQDDFIDSLPKDYESSDVARRKTVAQSIFGPERKFYRAAFRTLKASVKQSNDLDVPQQDYIIKRFTDWYRFLTFQEGAILGLPFEELNFSTCREYREEQNFMAGKTLTAALNGNTCLEESKQALEMYIPKLSYLTQVIDDIADLPEDLGARRPSYVVGALIDHPDELLFMQRVLAENKFRKITPAFLRQVAPQTAQQIDTLFQGYRKQLETDLGKNGRGLSILAQGMFDYFPYFRNLLYHIKPEFANF